ncbi:AraC family transcriptional regulator [Actinomycetospora soli]|uniref:AraC family transcriptional regulator n=1 Tax=Actinomycetospora soli TaxID=2893887 RepID=UPI001E62EB82|nr:AraC family transcriptional regulator [Actinomycetospora soli]MCD2185782.1 AraC family transcriptional regulator [Actinomycetospora soli]
MTTTMQVSAPLAAHRRVDSPDLDEARERVGEVFCPHSLRPEDRSGGHRVRFSAVDFGAVGLNYLEYGAPVRIAPEPFDSFVLVQIPLAGRARVRSGGEGIVSDPTTASVPDPDVPAEMTWGEGNAQLIVRMDRTALERQAALLGYVQGARLPLAMDLTTPAARAWRQTLDLLRADVEHDGRLDHPVLRPQVEQMVLSGLLLAHAPTSPDPASGTVVPRLIRKADDLIVAHAREPLTVEDVAECVGLSVRALQEGFRRHLDTTPTEQLRQVRLAGAHAELEAADPAATSVSAVASDWGFTHLGRFSIAYRRRYGCSPSEVLRR